MNTAVIKCLIVIAEVYVHSVECNEFKKSVAKGRTDEVQVWNER